MGTALTLLVPMFAAALLAGEAIAKPAPAARLELSIQGMSCDGCARQIESALRRHPGVRTARVDYEAARLTLEYVPQRTSPEKFVAAIASLGYRTDPGEVATSWGRYPPGADLVVISKAGESVDVERSLAAGKVTVVDFYADWCGPCKALDRRLAELVARHRDHLAIRKVNVGAWDTPVAKRYLVGAPWLPHVWAYDARGRRVAVLSGSEVSKLEGVVTPLLAGLAAAR